MGGLPIPDIVHIPQPYWYAEGGDLSPAEYGLKVARDLETKILELGVDRVAAFIGEPTQGAGGVIIPPDTYWPEVQRICDRHGILLVADEVICGFGRTGHWFGSDLYGIRPDLMTLAKGLSSGYLPIGAVMVADRGADVLIENGGEVAHGYTYSGHPVACAVASVNLAPIQQESHPRSCVCSGSSWLSTFLICIALVLIVLLQAGRGGGLSGAFGAGGTAQALHFRNRPWRLE